MPALPISRTDEDFSPVLSLAIVGLGALGSELCRQLAASGRAPAVVLLVDPDTLQPHNLPLSRVYAEVAAFGESGDSGQPRCFLRPKAELLAEALAGRSQTLWEPLAGEVADVGWQRLAAVDLLICCADNALARLDCTQIARALGKPMLDAAVLGGQHEGGRVAWFPAADGVACYACGLTDDRRAQMLAFTHAPTLGCRLPPEAAALGSDPRRFRSLDRVAAAAVAMIGSLDALGTESFALRLSPSSSETWSEERLRLQRSGGCPFHEPLPGRWVAPEHDTPLLDLFPPQDASAHRLQLPWPVCVEARCGHCGTADFRPQRLARLRRQGVCARCGATGTLDPLRTVSSIAGDCSSALRTPRQLGLPPKHLLLLRPAFATCTVGAKPPGDSGRGNDRGTS